MDFRFLLIAVVALGVAGCETGYKRSKVVTPQRLSCTGEVPASMTLYANNDVALTFEDKTYDLKRVETANGVKYANSDISIWNRGVSALITRADGSMTSCTFLPKPGL